MLYALCLVLIAVGLYGVVVKRNVVKIVIGLAIMEYGINLLLILIGYRRGNGRAPILRPGMDVGAFAASAVGPAAAGPGADLDRDRAGRSRPAGRALHPALRTVRDLRHQRDAAAEGIGS